MTIGQADKVNLRDAIKLAQGFNGDVARGIDPRLERRQAKQLAVVVAEQKAQAREMGHFTLVRLGEVYVEHLRQQQKASAYAVSNLFKNHLNGPVASIPANQITDEQVLTLLRKAAKAGARTSNTLLTCLKAAYNACLIKRAVQVGETTFDQFKVQTNPLQHIKPLPSGNQADRNPFSLREMRLHWEASKLVGGAYGSFLRLHVLLGGPRLAQLAGLRAGDVKDQHLELIDRKGRGGVARRYALPLTPSVKRELAPLLAGKQPEELLWPGPAGGLLDRSSVSDWGARANQHSQLKGFQLKRVRSGVETILGAAGVSKDTRAELQSHALGGVQSRHYDANLYLDEKAAALETLETLLNLHLVEKE